MDKDVLNEGVFFALQEPRSIADPYPLYHRLRSETPMYWDFVSSAWFLTRYVDVRSAIADVRLTTKNFPFDVSQLPIHLQKKLAPLGRVTSREVLHNDASEHDRLRPPLNRAFNPAAFEQVRSEMETAAGELLIKAARRRGIDFVADYADPFCNSLFGAILRLPHQDRARFTKWCDQVRNFTMLPRMGRETVLRATGAVKSFEQIRRYVRQMIIAPRSGFADNLIGRAFAAEPNEAPPSEDEILANCVFFLHSGVRNTSAAIVNAILVLLQHPRQLAYLRQNLQSLGVAIEELLRYETPLQVVTRGVPERIEFAGRQIGPNQLLVLLLGAANRDPGQFKNPDQLDLTRHPNRHLSFGAGFHGCVGAWLARFGLTICLGAIFDRQMELKLTRRKPDWSLPLIRRTVPTLPMLVRRRVQAKLPSRRAQVTPVGAARPAIAPACIVA